ncbi:MAG: putative toxin-antitoxin system toxin component, PIN family [Thermoanaerobaculia bacterium]
MRAVADTNIVVSGLLWHGSSRRILERARLGEIELFTSSALLAELQDVLSRRKFARRLELARVEPLRLVLGYAALARIVVPAEIPPAVFDDPDDDEILACAVAARAEVIVSGDSHLLTLKEFRGIRILRAAELAGLAT